MRSGARDLFTRVIKHVRQIFVIGLARGVAWTEMLRQVTFSCSRKQFYTLLPVFRVTLWAEIFVK